MPAKKKPTIDALAMQNNVEEGAQWDSATAMRDGLHRAMRVARLAGKELFLVVAMVDDHRGSWSEVLYVGVNEATGLRKKQVWLDRGDYRTALSDWVDAEGVGAAFEWYAR